MRTHLRAIKTKSGSVCLCISGMNRNKPYLHAVLLYSNQKRGCLFVRRAFVTLIRAAISLWDCNSFNRAICRASDTHIALFGAVMNWCVSLSGMTAALAAAGLR